MHGNALFTGERFIPGIKDDKLEIEHYQRYLSVRELVRDKTVLDAACGEGYGSNILAAAAKQVIGLDIDAETIKRAKTSYGKKNNLDFLQGSIAEIPLEDASVDIVVSFETIEHVNEELQVRFLEEITRVLKSDGLLVMSTPNKEVYSDRYDYKNEFHIKEFYHDEFISFLKEKFKHVKLYNQAFQIVSMVNSCGNEEETISYYADRPDYDQSGKYYIALASNKSVEEYKIASVYMGETGEYEKNVQRILMLQKEEEERNRHIRKLDEEAAHAGEVIRNLQEENQDKSNHIRVLDSQIENQNQIIRENAAALEERKSEIEERRSQVEEWRRGFEHQKSRIEEQEREIESQRSRMEEQEREIESQRSRMEEQEREIESQRSRMEEQDREIENQRGRIEEQHREIEEQRKRIEEQNVELGEIQKQIEECNRIENELRQVIRNKEGHIELLLETEREYEREKKTHSYRFGKKVQRVGNFILPPDSRRRFFARVLFNLFRHPKLMLHVINPKRIKNYRKYMKLEGIEGVKRCYEEAVNLEKSRLGIIESPELEVVQQNAGEENHKGIEEYEKIILPTWESPTVSIVIPVYNQFDYTYYCVKSIVKNSGSITYEIIIANDCSTDITQDIEKIIQNVRLITTEQNVRFLLNCNHAAKYAKGEYILFLNNDTQVQENWLEPLVALIERDNTIGMVGSKLIYPDGRLQEAGGIVWKDASAWNYGNQKNPQDPEFNYVKEVDYISGAAIMIRHKLWKEIGGFDERFAPAYYEDDDLAFEVRKRGFKVVYQPLSQVVHFEGISNGTDVQTGTKRYQQVNFEKFYDKWKEVLEAEHEVNAENVFTARDRSGHKKHILVVDHYVPHHDQDAGGKCTFMYLQTFVKMGFQVTFIGDNFYRHEPYTTELNQFGIEVLYGDHYYNNWQEWLEEHGHYFDYIYLQRPHISIKYIDIVKRCSQAKVFYFAHDLHHIREYREYEMTGDPEKLASSEKWKKIEYELFQKADVGHVVGCFEQQKMQEAFPDKPIRNIPLYIYEGTPTDINKDFASRKDILYVGGFGHPPNTDAVLWFAREIFPKVLARYPDVKWHIVGNKAPLEVQELASDNIIVEGFLPDEDLERLYRECRLAVVPLRYGAGVKGKVVEAAYYQIPLVTTPIGAEGLSLVEHFMVVEDTADGLADAVCSLYEDYPKLREMSDNGISFIQNHFTLEEAERVLRLDIDI